LRRLRLRIHGIVQGVGFRWFVRSNARSLGLVGYVRNVPDGSVEVVAEGEEEALRKLADLCRRGPMLARVERVQEEWSEATGEFSSFDIRW